MRLPEKFGDFCGDDRGNVVDFYGRSGKIAEIDREAEHDGKTDQTVFRCVGAGEGFMEWVKDSPWGEESEEVPHLPIPPPPLTPRQQEVIELINKMPHYEMCRLWRFAPSGHEYFSRSLPYAEVFRKRLFEQLGGFTSEISKALGHGSEGYLDVNRETSVR
jgi:hypothetical protein